MSYGQPSAPTSREHQPFRSETRHHRTDILCAWDQRAYESEPDEDMPAKQFVLGFDTHGRLIELVILTFDSGNRLVIHAMKARRHLYDLLD